MRLHYVGVNCEAEERGNKVYTAVQLRTKVFWDMTLRRWVSVYRRSEGK
jgi:hypothetical protein